jgi:hypothetical protein
VLDIYQGPVQQVNRSGSGSHTFVAPSEHVEMQLVLNSASQIWLAFNPNDVDSVATKFYAEATFAVHQVPEPSGFVLLAIGVGVCASTINRARRGPNLRGHGCSPT